MSSLEERIDYKFCNSLLLAEALTHPSLAHETQNSRFDNQRLEFLGDAVLQLVLTNELFSQFPDFTEGALTKLRCRLVSGKALKEYALGIKLGDSLFLGKGEEKSGGRTRESILADAFESLVGAIYLDSGLDSAKDFILFCCNDKMARVIREPVENNPKGELQEILQHISQHAPEYVVVEESGPDHSRNFLSRVTWQGQTLGQGSGKSKKQAESAAALGAIENKLWLEEKECE